MAGDASHSLQQRQLTGTRYGLFACTGLDRPPEILIWTLFFIFYFSSGSRRVVRFRLGTFASAHILGIETMQLNTQR